MERAHKNDLLVYKLYGLTAEEQDFIEKMIKPMEQRLIRRGVPSGTCVFPAQFLAGEVPESEKIIIFATETVAALASTAVTIKLHTNKATRR